jgi:hypothetical protein
MLPGPAVDLGSRPVLVSSARVRVTRYLKGKGPYIVTEATGVIRVGDGGRCQRRRHPAVGRTALEDPGARPLHHRRRPLPSDLQEALTKINKASLGAH